jgi:ufm1-conjugating enzyme 1
LVSGGKICIDVHFAPLWQKNAPKFGIAHALAIAVSQFNKNLMHSLDLGLRLKFLF